MCFPALLLFWAWGIIPESLMMTSVITLYQAYRVNDHPHVPMSLVSLLSCGDYLSSCSSQRRRPGGLCVSSQFCKELPLTVNALFCHTKFSQWHLCCFGYYVLTVGSMKLTREETEKSWNGFDASDTSIYKREKGFYSTQHTGGIEGEWLFRSSFQSNRTVESQLLLCVSTLRMPP